MPKADDTMHIPASRGQIEEAVWTLMKTLQLHPDAPVVPGLLTRNLRNCWSQI